jgi:hypothetical protein
MKKLIIVLSLFLVSCSEDKVTISTEEYNMLKTGKVPEYPKKIIIHNTYPGDIVKVDECEYIVYAFGGYHGTMTHKGNCRFCQKRSEETIRKIIQEELQKCK